MTTKYRLKIHEPYWKYNAVGVALKHFYGRDKIEVEIMYRYTNGRRFDETIYLLTQKELTENCVVIEQQRGTELYIIPINQMRRVE